MTPEESHEGGLSVREQIERYRTAFIAVVTMILIAALVGGYVLAHENLKLPSWVPVLGRSYFVLKGEFQTAQAVTPGQGQSVTIAGAKIGEIASVDLHNGVAIVTMKVTPKYALIYRNATLLLRPKTQLKDMTVEVSPGSPSSGRLRSGETIPLAQTAPDVNFDEFLSSLDAETRDYLQELLAGAGEGLKHNGKALSAVFKRFDPTARDLQLISAQLATRHVEIARSIHNFKLLMEAFGDKDKQLADVIQASNAVFATFAQENQSVQSTLRLLPGALSKTEQGLGKLATAFNVLGPTLKELHPFASSLAPAQEALRPFFKTTTPILKNDIRPFAREVLPTIDAIAPSTKELAESFPQLASSFSVLNEFFNEIAYNPGKNRGGFLFFLDWDSHNLNSVVSSADAHGTLGRSLLYLNCEVLPLLAPAATVNETVNIIVGLVNPPTKAACKSAGILKGATVAAARGGSTTPAGGLFSGLNAPVFGRLGSGTTAGSNRTRARAGVGTSAKRPSAIAQAGATGTTLRGGN
jgi:phospholipid/cholesterol/gamma-HCH transport system substrate-binding protein